MESTPVGEKTPDANIPATVLTPIGEKTSDPKTPTTDSSARKEKARKECVVGVLGLTFFHQLESIRLLVCLRLAFLHQQESIPKVVDSFQSFCAQIVDFPSKF